MERIFCRDRKASGSTTSIESMGLIHEAKKTAPGARIVQYLGNLRVQQ